MEKETIMKNKPSEDLYLRQWHIEHIEEGVKRAKAGEIATDEEAEAQFDKLTK